MNRRGINGWLVGIAAIVVLGAVAWIAYSAGAASGGRIGFMRDGMGVWMGGFGWSFGWLLMLVLIVGIVWALVSLLRPADRQPPPPPPGWTWREPPGGMPTGSTPTGSTPPGSAPPQGPGGPPLPSGYAEAFEAWHRQAHAQEPGTVPTPGAAGPEEAAGPEASEPPR